MSMFRALPRPRFPRPLGAFLVFGLGAAAGLHAQVAGCTAKDMQGAWAAQPTGFFTAGPVAGPFAATGLEVFDGVGRFTGIATSSFDGQIIYPFGADGSYTVTPDCKVHIFEETLRITFDGYLANNKTEALLMEPDPTSISVVGLHRQNLDGCTAATVGPILKDTWLLSALGYNIITGGRYAWNAKLQFNGAGAITGTGSSSTHGVISSNTYTGVYSVLADCSFNFRVTDDKGAAFGYYGTLFDGGRQFLFVANDPGLVIPGIAKKP